jgi:hypothetical protein
LRDKGYDESEINDVGNFWILAKGKNLNKTNMPPINYFTDVDPSVLKKGLIDPELLGYGQFRKFTRQRKQQIIDQLKIDLHFSDADFQFAAEA